MMLCFFMALILVQILPVSWATYFNICYFNCELLINVPYITSYVISKS